MDPEDDLDALVSQYDSVLRDILNKHAPEITRSVQVRPHAPWFSEEIRQARLTRRKFERFWRKQRTEVNRQLFRAQSQVVCDLVDKAKLAYHRSRIEVNGSKDLFSTVNELLGKVSSSPLPDHKDPKELAENFCAFFMNKIFKIRERLDLRNMESEGDEFQDDPASTNIPLLDSFSPTTEDEVRNLVLSLPSKSCALDPIPTTLLKQCLGSLLPVLVSVINKSLLHGHVPTSLKFALVKPLLKKPTLDKDELGNYRPVSNLTYISKLVERIVAVRLRGHMLSNQLLDPNQSAYRQGHSTETVLLKVTNDILTSLDTGHEVLLVLLDLSAAFDTVDHTLLLDRLQTRIGLGASALTWFKSYLQDRHLSVSIAGSSSQHVALEFGVPQGSVLGPVLFTIYTIPLGDVISRCSIPYQLFADDSQLQDSARRGNMRECSSLVTSMEGGIGNVQYWLTRNMLAMNATKTDMANFVGARSLGSIPAITIDGVRIQSASCVKDLGAWLDQDMSMQTQIKMTCKAAYAWLYKIGRIRKFLNKKSAERLVHALVTSRLDSNNGLLYGLPAKTLAPLQRVQNMAARMVCRQGKFDHVTPLLKNLHWLPIKARIEYKILCVVHKTVNGIGPQYLRDLLRETKGRTRSSTSGHLHVMRSKSRYGDRTFSKCGPSLWNNLPVELRTLPENTFRRQLKARLFSQVFQ